MSFFTKSITIDENSNPINPKHKSSKLGVLLGITVLSLGAFFVYKLVTGAYQVISSFSMKDAVFSLGTDLKVENDNTNFLLMGIGGENHEGGDLTDSLMVVSLNHRLNTLTTLSLPRDLYVKTDFAGYHKINEIYVYAKNIYTKKDPLAEVAKTVESVIAMPIQYYVLVDFQGFEKVVDIINGIEVEVENSFTDYKYPNNNYGRKTISFKKGLQVMDGQIALEFARSRHAVGGEGSDFARGLRQQKVVKAILNKLLENKIFESPSKIKDLYGQFSAMVKTNLELREMLSLAKIAQGLNLNNIKNFNLSDGLGNGFVYSPTKEEMDNSYNGVYVLLPIGGDWKRINRFADLIFNHPEIYLENTALEIINGTTVQWLAYICSNNLKKYGFNVVGISNSKRTKLYLNTEMFDLGIGENNETKKLLMELLPAVEVSATEETWPTEATIKLVLGKDNMCYKF